MYCFHNSKQLGRNQIFEESTQIRFEIMPGNIIDFDDHDDDFEEYIRAQDAKNTVRGNKYAVNTVSRFFKSINETREIQLIPPAELNNLLSKFFMMVKKVDGQDFEPDCLSTIFRGLKRHLDTEKYPINILKDDKFTTCRRVLAAKRKELTRLGLGSKPNATRELTVEEVDILFEGGYFSTSNAESLQRAMWWFLSIHFGYRARDEARKLCWGDVTIEFDEIEQKEYLLWNAERGTKTRRGEEGDGIRAYNPVIYACESARCPISYFKQFALHRPKDACHPDSPFFLAINWKSNDVVWYHNRAMGKNTIGSILSNARKKYGFKGGKVANHSVRKTGIGRLLDSEVPEIFVAQHSGMSSVDSLKSYKGANKKQKINMSNILNEENNTINTTMPSTSNDSAQQGTISLSQQSSNSASMFANASFNNCTFNFGACFKKEKNNSRKRLMIESSSDEVDFSNIFD